MAVAPLIQNENKAQTYKNGSEPQELPRGFTKRATGAVCPTCCAMLSRLSGLGRFDVLFVPVLGSEIRCGVCSFPITAGIAAELYQDEVRRVLRVSLDRVDPENAKLRAGAERLLAAAQVVQLEANTRPASANPPKNEISQLALAELSEAIANARPPEVER